MNKHTPGPWFVDGGSVWKIATESYKTAKGRTALPGSMIPIAQMDRELGNGTLPVERDANARLIAAAPVMYERIKYLLECKLTIDEVGPAIQDLKDIIKEVEK